MQMSSLSDHSYAHFYIFYLSSPNSIYNKFLFTVVGLRRFSTRPRHSNGDVTFFLNIFFSKAHSNKECKKERGCTPVFEQ